MVLQYCEVIQPHIESLPTVKVRDSWKGEILIICPFYDMSHTNQMLAFMLARPIYALGIGCILFKCSPTMYVIWEGSWSHMTT